MRILIKNARIVETSGISAPTELLIENGVIRHIGVWTGDQPVDQYWEAPDLHVSIGWMDIGVHVCDPGMEHREDLESAAAAAAKGGFTMLACFPNSVQAAHSKSEIQYIKAKAKNLSTKVLPIGAVSHELAGKDLAELFDMHEAGAVAFSDADKAIQDTGLLLRALQYAKAFDGLVFDTPYNRAVAAGGQMHEGLQSTMLGLKGIPVLAEILQIQRDLSLLRYAEGRLHLHLVSSQAGVELIRAAKAEGLAVTCSVSMANLCYTDEKLAGFDSNWKVTPPLRAETDRQALINGLLDGTIDFICSNHSPWDEECKNLEFPYAEFGMNGLETFFSSYMEGLREYITLSQFIEKVAVAPRKVLGLKTPSIKIGEIAELTLFQPEVTWAYSQSLSKSKNSPLLGQILQGKVLGTIWQNA
jgi:dihydroorotase